MAFITDNPSDSGDCTECLKKLPGFGPGKQLITDSKGTILWARFSVDPSNVPPVANAGADQIVNLPADGFTLTGSATDTEGAIIAHLWEQASGPNNAINTTPRAQRTSIAGIVAGVYVFRYTATDEHGATHSDTMQATVNPEPAPEPEPGGGMEDFLAADFLAADFK